MRYFTSQAEEYIAHGNLIREMLGYIYQGRNNILISDNLGEGDIVGIQAGMGEFEYLWVGGIGKLALSVAQQLVELKVLEKKPGYGNKKFYAFSRELVGATGVYLVVLNIDARNELSDLLNRLNGS